jgi:hypothetical protein
MKALLLSQKCAVLKIYFYTSWDSPDNMKEALIIISESATILLRTLNELYVLVLSMHMPSVEA